MPSNMPSTTEPSSSPTSSPTFQTVTVDMFGNHIVPISEADSFAVSSFTPDDVAPEIISFAVDMDAMQLYLSFTEPVRVSTLFIGTAAARTQQIELVGTSGSSYYLTGGSLAQTGTLLAEFDITEDDMNNIKTEVGLFDAAVTSALRLGSSFVLDMAGNQLAAGSAISAANYEPDSVSPTLRTYRLDLNHGTLLLNFDEPVDTSSLIVNGNVAISNSDDGSGDGSGNSDPSAVFLAGGNTTSDSGMQVLVMLTYDDVQLLKQRENLATSQEDTFLSFDGTFIADMAGNAIVPIDADEAQGAANYVDDSTRPELLHFALDMASEPGIISLSFSEIVDAAALRPELMILQEGLNVERNDSSTFHALQQGTMLNLSTYDQLTVTMQLTAHDYQTLKLKHIGDNASVTYLSTAENFIVDQANRGASALMNGVDAHHVDNLVVDNTKPRLQYFDVDMNQGKLDFFFSEPVDASTMNTEAVRLQNMRASD